MSKKILWCSEATNLSTGYATYSREVLKRLHRSGKYEIAELACYCQDGSPYVDQVPWKVYPVIPRGGEEEEHYRRDHAGNGPGQFGALRFESVCLDFQPDIVADIKDPWMFVHTNNSPFRKCYNWVLMPTCDSAPQQRQWLEVFSSAEYLFTYQDWSLGILQKNGLNVSESAPPSASDNFSPKSLQDRQQLKSVLGLGPDVIVIGTVMRNQARKLYPDLFKSFRMFLDKTGRNDVVLYCHTSYPDNGWEIPDLIKEYGLSSKVYLTYICNLCGNVQGCTYQDVGTGCTRCGQFSCSISSAQNGVDEETLNCIYNMMDLYVQYSNSEGFGIGMVESASVGTPICAVDYSAMSDVVRKLDGYPIKVKAIQKEVQTGCGRAIPDNEDFVEYLERFVNLPTPIKERKRVRTEKLARENYIWDETADKWAKAFNKCKPGNWKKPPALFSPANYHSRDELNHHEYAEWLIREVLGEPEKLNTYFHTRIVRDLNYGIAVEGLSGLYYNDMAHKFTKIQNEPFTREIAYNKMVELCNRRNFWEQQRSIKFGIG